MPSFDIVSEVDLQEVDNAVNGAKREVDTRYDFKGTNSEISHEGAEITLLASDNYKLQAMQDMLKGHMVKRKIDPKSLDFQKEEMASGNMMRQKVVVKQGIDQDTAKKIVKAIKDAKLKKVQASIRGEELRVTGPKRDDLQGAIQLVKGLDVELPLQYINFRD